MHQLPSQTDWRHLRDRATPRLSTSGCAPARVRVLTLGLLIVMAVIFARVVSLELIDGATYREIARRPLQRTRSLPGVRGRILARDGTVLAHDTPIVALAVHYRYLQQPANARWLREMSRRRLPRSQRNDADRQRAAERLVLSDRAELHRRLRQICDLTNDKWNERTERIQRKVQRIAASVNARHKPPSAAPNAVAGTNRDDWWRRLRHTIADALRSGGTSSQPWITVAEELDYHVVADGLPLNVVAEIEAHPEAYPGVRIVQSVRRAYPRGTLAAHALGHLGAVSAEELGAAREEADGRSLHSEDLIGRNGIERQYEAQLRGRRGELVELTDRGGRRLKSHRRAQPGAGRDLVLTIDVALQQTAESLLDDALTRRPLSAADRSRSPAGGAIVVMDVRSGAVLATASAPRFDPNLFSAGNDQQLAKVLADENHPLLDRVTKMQIPPGSVFKTVSAIALLESGLISSGQQQPEEPLYCRGYLHQPDRRRCLIFRRHGHGHGQMTLTDALTQSCNVYFFHYAGEMGPAPLIWWARQTGFGKRTGIDLPDEAPGKLSATDLLTTDSSHAVDALALAIGQGTLTVTPLQIVRLMAAVANGGELVTPRVVSRVGLVEMVERNGNDDGPESVRIPPPRPIPDLNPATLRAVRRGLERVVSQTDGTAHATVYLQDVAVAGKTGTAETGGGRADHAWFAGYVPAERPRWAFVVVLQHAGGGSVAGPIAQRLVRKMQSLGHLSTISTARVARH